MSARERALAFIENECAMGRGRVVLPAPLPAPTLPSPAAAPRPGEASAAVPAGGGTSGSRSRRAPAEKSYGPLANLRSDEVVARIANALAPIDAKAQQCVACDLSKTRKRVVFGTGSGRSGIVFVGEAPGASEDEQGIPFVGRAGQLLDRILGAIGVAREDVYICNVIKCRPPGNRDPQPLEVATCAPFLNEQIEALEPRIICALGLHAARRLLNVTQPMARLRGQLMEVRGVPAIATYHPAALLRNPSLKRPTWEDFQLLRRLAEQSKA